MAWVAVAVAGSSLVGGMMASDAQSEAAGQASASQVESTRMGIEEQRRQFDAVQRILQPFVTAGTQGLSGQSDLLGLNGAASQQAAIDAISRSPMFGELAKQGEEAILQNASATGGLRGGNTQGALAQFRPSLLSALIDQQYARLGGFTSLGQNAAAGVGNAGMASGNAVTQLLQQQGAAQAGGALAAGRAQAQGINSVAGAIGQIAGRGGFGSGQGYNLQAQFSQTPVGQSGFGSGLAYGNQDLGQFL